MTAGSNQPGGIFLLYRSARSVKVRSEMPTPAERDAMRAQIRDLVDKNYPNMPRSWRRIMAHKAFNRWLADQVITNSTPAGQEQMNGAMADTL